MEIEDRIKVKRQQLLYGNRFDFIQESQLDIIEKDMHRCGFIRKSRQNEGVHKIKHGGPPMISVHVPSISSTTKDDNYSLSRTSRPPLSPRRSLFVENDQLSNCFTPDDEKSIILTSIIIDVLQCFKGKLHYYQGFHNIAAIFLLTLGNISLTTSTLKMVASLYLRETMQPNFEMLK